ncbi:TolC family protein [Pedobacter sp. HMWF019]|uniref:TolC family protein n=1 Tax=Pedobacter sp. HMWF019 TaxID=2056856 RepID=UPI000D3A59AF|nr:TolC family protein [Pedobacter sp. HMWF019]PTT00546.1 TolC family protein [Pedobacter sp. HMWF019]
MKRIYNLAFPIVSLLLFNSLYSYGQNTTLQQCLDKAYQNNLTVKQARTSLQASKFNLQAEKQSYLPKVDLLSSYTYLSKPIDINLQTVKDGIVNGSSAQSLNAVNEVFKEITGSDLSQPVQDRILNASKKIIGAIYPDYNPSLSKQSYFVAGLGVRQPLYLGNKLSAARNLASSLVETTSINVQVANKEVNFMIAAQYVRILYLNSILNKQQFIVDALTKNKNYAAEMVKNQVLPPYQKNWTNVFLTQAQSIYNNLKLDKQNALVELNKLMGTALDSAVQITDTLKYTIKAPEIAQPGFYESNPIYKLVDSKTAYAKTSEKVTRSFALPNVFAIGNYNLYQKDLPLTIPDWFVGVELQWTLFNGQTRKRTQAARELIEESKLAEKNTSQTLQAAMMVAGNKIKSLQNDVAALDTARKEAGTTSRLITERMKNQLSSPKDVNDALLVEAEIEKAYYTAVMGYYLTVAEYYNILGKPQQFTEFIP